MTLLEALHHANIFITIEEDKYAFMIKYNATKMLAVKLADTKHEPWQDTSYKKKIIVYILCHQEWAKLTQLQ